MFFLIYKVYKALILNHTFIIVADDWGIGLRLILSGLNLPLAYSSPTSRELLSQLLRFKILKCYWLCVHIVKYNVDGFEMEYFSNKYEIIRG